MDLTLKKISYQKWYSVVVRHLNLLGKKKNSVKIPKQISENEINGCGVNILLTFVSQNPTIRVQVVSAPNK